MLVSQGLMTATVHMICGPVGAGKTTYARAYAAKQRAVVFVLDEWMATLFMMDAPQPIALDWALPRVERCEAQIWKVAQDVMRSGVDVVVELGFFRRDQRDRFRALATAAGAPVVVHAVGAAPEVRRERVRARNRGGANLTVEVDDAMFDWAEGYYEVLGDDELRGAVLVDTERAA
jgi:predicted kinase